ncbi:MGH1-like glycoside hydrolase domain-containing protein [Alistipes sp.]|uniref:MGH1-like glycoside hydrolase domain-containing protein n=1 Tax=Alistipes sp. TaxID=1872444 RepID=UPI003AF1B3D1
MKKTFFLLAQLLLGLSLQAQTICSDDERLDDAYRLAVNTMDINVRRGILAAGADYGGEWTRDIAINAWNAVSLLRPAVAERSLWSVTLGRDTVGHQYWDKALWIIAAANHYALTGDRRFLCDAYRCGVNTLTELETMAFDPADGLFTGPSVFNDGISGYPPQVYDPEVVSSYVLDHPNARRIKTLSTNCVYCGAYRALGFLAEELGEPQHRIREFASKGEALKRNILRRFTLPSEPRLAYLIDHTGARDVSQEALGLSFAVLLGVVEGDLAAELIRQAVVSPHGIPSIWPDFANFSPARPGRHNNLVWPMPMGFFARAAIRTGNSSVFLHELDALTGLALDEEKGNYNFREIYDPRTGKPDGGYQMLDPSTPDMHWRSCSAQVWSATAYLSMVHYGVLGIRTGRAALRFEPLLPPGTERVKVSGLHYGASAFEVEVRGPGTRVKTVLLDGRPVAGNELPRSLFDGAYRRIRIELEP